MPLLRLLLLLVLTGSASAFTPFTVSEIRPEGLQRIAPGTVFNYLPLEPGSVVTPAIIEESMNRLYQTGFFNDVAFEREGTVLIIQLDERPSIAKITLTGNSDLESEQLLSSLKLIGLKEGHTFNNSLLDKVVLELKQQYMTLGKYNSRITPKVERLPRNRVALNIVIDEGREAAINRLKILGNQHFSTEELMGILESGEPGLIPFLGSKAQYSRQKLSGDLETLRSYYMDRGFINFAVESTQVNITPEREDIYITANLNEGEPYRVREIAIAGDTIVPKEELRQLITLQTGDLFSRSAVTRANEKIAEKLGDNGYAFANVNPIPQMDEVNHEVSLTFFVDPGKRVYVRRINLSGHHRTQDEVLRRELRQMEAGWISTARVKRSKTRLDRLGYFDEVSIKTPPVAGTADQVDLDLSVVEKDAFGNLSAGVGYSNAQGLLLNASITQDNFLGTGRRFSIKVDNSDTNTIYSMSVTEPYLTLGGVSQTIALSYRDSSGSENNTSDYDLKSYTFGPSYSIPISEYNTIRSGLTYENTELYPNGNTQEEILSFCDGVATREQCRFDTYRWRSAFAHDTRNRKIFPNQGGLSEIATILALPVTGQSLEFYKLELTQRNYFKLSEAITLVASGEADFANYYGDTPVLPPFERYHAGGADSVRGFRNNSLGTTGTLDSLGDSLGGDTRLLVNAELIFPPPFDEQSNAMRIGLFVDGGNVFQRRYGIAMGDMRYSAGLSLSWFTPIGPLKFSYGVPLRSESTDVEEAFQFSIGVP